MSEKQAYNYIKNANWVGSAALPMKQELYYLLDLMNESFPFNENSIFWKQYLKAESGESGDYPDNADFLFWIVDKIKELLEWKKRWLGGKNE